MDAEHYEQQYPNSCVPACMCILQKWRGLSATEDAFHGNAARDGHSLTLAVELGRVRLRSIAPGEEDEIDLALRLGHRIIAKVSGPPYIRWFVMSYPTARSRHGSLCAPGDRGKPFHAIVLVDHRRAGYRYHDPWYPADDQPFWMSEEDFQRCFAGEIAVAEP